MPDRLRLKGSIQTDGQGVDPCGDYLPCWLHWPGPHLPPGFPFPTMRAHPISPVTEPLQYRAIGVVRGLYVPTDPEQPTRGLIRTADGSELEAVVLGRLLTLMRRHLAMDKPHLWVVYPRSRDENQLHLQMVGVWEPSTLGAVATSAATDGVAGERVAGDGVAGDGVANEGPVGASSEAATDPPEATAAPPEVATADPSETAAADALQEGDDYFSVRGELIYTRPETGDLVVKVRQLPRADGSRPIPFKLQLRGEVPLEHLRHFVALDLRRQGQQLCLEQLEVVAPLAQRGTRGGKSRRQAGGPGAGAGGPRPGAGRRGSDRPGGERTGDERPGNDSPRGERPGGERPGGERPSADRRPRELGSARPTDAPPRSHGQAVGRPSR